MSVARLIRTGSHHSLLHRKADREICVPMMSAFGPKRIYAADTVYEFLRKPVNGHVNWKLVKLFIVNNLRIKSRSGLVTLKAANAAPYCL